MAGEIVTELGYVRRDVADAGKRLGGVIAKTRQVAADAARLGAHAVAAHLDQVARELETARGTLAGAEKSVSDTTDQLDQAHRGATPQEVADLLSRADRIVQASGDGMLGGLDDMDRAEQLVRAALDGGQPGPLLSEIAAAKAAVRDGLHGTTTAQHLITDLAAAAKRLGDTATPGAETTPTAAIRTIPADGPGGDWRISNEVRGSAVKQTTPGSCVAACGQMLTNSHRGQATILASIGEWSYSETLARDLTTAGEGSWVGGYVEPSFNAIVARGKPWAAEMFPHGGGPNPYHHMVVVDQVGTDTVHIRDPWDGSGYDMALEEFTHRWTGKGVVNNG